MDYRQLAIEAIDEVVGDAARSEAVLDRILRFLVDRGDDKVSVDCDGPPPLVLDEVFVDEVVVLLSGD